MALVPAGGKRGARPPLPSNPENPSPHHSSCQAGSPGLPSLHDDSPAALQARRAFRVGDPLAGYRKIIAFRNDSHEFVYPACQFDQSRPNEGLDRVVGYFPSPEEAWERLVTPNLYTDSAAPIDRLGSGHIEVVIRAAEGVNDYQ